MAHKGGELGRERRCGSCELERKFGRKDQDVRKGHKGGCHRQCEGKTSILSPRSSSPQWMLKDGKDDGV